MSNIEISAEDLMMKNKEACLAPNARSFSSTNFWHYTTLKAANLILKNHCFHVRNLKEMNDLSEASLHNGRAEFTHILCFCNSNSEKIPMWYLYSGITGHGASMGFTPSAMLKLMESIGTITTVDDSVILKKGIDFEIESGWVFYRKKDEKKKVYYRTKWYEISDSENLFQDENYFIKDYPWEYEKEFRIVIKNKTKISHDKLVIKLPDNLYKSLKIKLAPEIDNKHFLSLHPELDGFNVFFENKLQCSDLSVCMNLCNRNFDDFIEYIENESRKENSSIDFQSICAAVSNAKKCLNKEK